MFKPDEREKRLNEIHAREKARKKAEKEQEKSKKFQQQLETNKRFMVNQVLSEFILADFESFFELKQSRKTWILGRVIETWETVWAVKITLPEQLSSITDGNDYDLWNLLQRDFQFQHIFFEKLSKYGWNVSTVGYGNPQLLLKEKTSCVFARFFNKIYHNKSSKQL